MADGVPADRVYEVLATTDGQDLAFAKLDAIKDEVIWFDSWSQAPQILNDGGAVMVQTANGRMFEVINKENRPFSIVWDGVVYDMDSWAIVRGSPNKELALQFIGQATSSEALAGFQEIAYGSPRKSSAALVDENLIDHLPSTHVDKGIKADPIFWADYGESLGERFNQWMLN